MRDALPTVVNELGRLIAAPQNAIIFDAFLRACQVRCDPYVLRFWALSHDVVRARELAMALYLYRGKAVQLSIIEPVAVDAASLLQAALPHFTDEDAAIHFLGTVWRFPSGRSMSEHLLDALRQHACDNCAGMRRLANPR